MTSSSYKRRLPPNTLISRLFLGTMTVMGLCCWLILGLVQSHEDGLAEERSIAATEAEARQLRAEAAALASFLDGDQHEALATGFGETRFDTWEGAPAEVLAYRSELEALVTQLGSDAQVHTYRIKSDERLVVAARSNEVRPDALQELFSTGPESKNWATDSAYLPDMELPLVPHQAVSVELTTDDDSTLAAFAAIEGRSGELMGFVRMDKPVPVVESLGDERAGQLIPIMAGITLLVGAVLLVSSAALRRDLRSLKQRISQVGKDDEDVIPAMLGDFREILEQADQVDQSMSRKLAREEASRAELESRLRDAELGLCPSRLAQRRRFASVADSVVCTIGVDPKQSVPASLIDLTLDEAILGIPSGGTIDLAPGFPARVRVTSPADEMASEFVVETLKQATVGKTSLVRLRITNPANLRSLPREIRHLVDNRRSVRVKPDPRNPVTARLAFNRGREEINSRLVDVSAEGAGVLLRTDLWKVAAWGATVELRLVIPGSEQSVKIPARISNVHRSSGRVRLGLNFDLSRIANNPHYKRLLDYLARRQSELQGLMTHPSGFNNGQANKH